MIKEKINQLIEASLRKLLDDQTIREMIIGIVLKSNDISLTVNNIRILIDNVSSLNSNLQQTNESVCQIIDTLKMHQDAIKNLVLIQDSLSKKAKISRNDDMTLFTETTEKPTKPN